MTEILERRWKCDYCGNVSPVLTNAIPPNGWVVVRRGDHKSGYIMTDLHFCCALHETLYISRRADVVVMTEEVPA